MHHYNDTKTQYDRVPDQSLKTERNRIITYILLFLVISLMYLIAHQMQDYLQSFATNKHNLVQKFYPIPDVPRWVLTIH